MIRLALVLGAIGLLHPQQPVMQFVAMDVYAETGSRGLAAWQVEIECDPGQARIVGVEAGENPPSYDPAALQGGRIILASFTTDPQPPRGRVRVARVHFAETGHPRYSARLMAAASPGGERFVPAIELVRAGGK